MIIDISHEYNIYGELILKTRVNDNLIKRRYLYYSLEEAKEHFRKYLNDIL